jgi:hypothetical protein
VSLTSLLPASISPCKCCLSFPFPSHPSTAPVSKSLSLHSRVILVCAERPFQQVAVGLRKLGLQPGPYEDKGLLSVLDLVSHPPPPPPSTDTRADPDPSNAPSTSAAAFDSSVIGSPGGLRALYAELARRAAAAAAGPFTLLIDSVSALAALSGSPGDTLALARSLVALATTSSNSSSSLAAASDGAGGAGRSDPSTSPAAPTAGPPSSSVILGVHRGIEEDDLWMAPLEHLAALVVDVRPLETGRAMDVHGQVVLRSRLGPLASLLTLPAAPPTPHGSTLTTPTQHGEGCGHVGGAGGEEQLPGDGWGAGTTRWFFRLGEGPALRFLQRC